MITLDATLQAAQDGDNHQPIIKLVSTSFADSIPFEGAAFDASETDDGHPDLITLSTGAMACVAGRGNDLVLLVTDTNRTEWSVYTILEGSVVCQPTVVELSNGDLGIVYRTTGYDLYYMVIATDGTVKTATTLINNYTTWISAPSVELLANGTFVLVYAYKNGSDEHSISKRTSSNFTSWSGATTIAPSGLDNTMRMDNPDIFQVTSGQVFMTFDYVDDVADQSELINCYYMTSDDNGATWSSPGAITAYSDMSTIGSDPVIAERADERLEIGFVESRPLLYMNNQTTGWDGHDGLDEVPNMHYNPASGKLIFSQVYTYVGNKFLDGITVVDVDTWTIDKVYTYSSSPAINQLFYNFGFSYEQDLGEGKYCCGCSINGLGNNHIIVVDTELDTITYRSFKANATYGLPKTVASSDDADNLADGVVEYTQVDGDNDRLYITGNYDYNRTVGYFDLTEQPDGETGEYTYYPIVDMNYWISGRNMGITGFRVVPDEEMILTSHASGYEQRALRIYSLEGSLLYEFNNVNDAGFHRNGIFYPVYYNGHVYGGTTYESGYDQGDRYGLMDINLSTREIRYHRPSWGTYDDYYLNQKKVLDDGRILIAARTRGLTIFNPATETWDFFNGDNVPGLMTTVGTHWCTVDYDEVNDVIFSSTDVYTSSSSGIVAFPEAGKFEQLKYKTATYTTAWGFSSATALTNTRTEQSPALAIDYDDALWSVWDHTAAGDDVLYWDNESAEKDLTEYLTNDAVSVSWEIDSTATVSFTLSHGYLFDSSNTLSTIAQHLAKGRKVELSMGEIVSSVDYLQAQGVFVITETRINYERGKYPTIRVTCEDMRSVWENGNVVATEYFSNNTPVGIMTALVEDHGGLVSEDINFPIIVGAHNLYHQFLDQDLTEMLDNILGHFGYFLHFDTDGKVSAKRINLSQSIDHIYTDEISNYTPDDSFSNFTNRVVVKGEGHDFLEVLYDVESIGTMTGTVLPFGGTKTKRVWFSEDHDRTCRNAYLSVNTSIREFELFLVKGGGNEYISAVDTNEHYVDVTMEAPDLTGVFIGLAAAIVATGTAAIECTAACGPFIFALSIETQLLAYALGALAQYDYEIYASPVGHEKQTFQADSNDYVLQRQLDGLVIIEDIDDPFCYTVQSCQAVADRELAVVQAQRKRVSFSKPAHLQDEIGDMIQINHPYTGLPVQIFVTALTRTWQKGKGVTDKIEGWRV